MHRVRRRRQHVARSAAQASPPSTSAPSPPMTTSPARAGIATHSAVSISGAARCSVFCHENQSPNAPLNRSARRPRTRADAGERRRTAPNSSSAAGWRAPAARSRGEWCAWRLARSVRRRGARSRQPLDAARRLRRHRDPCKEAGGHAVSRLGVSRLPRPRLRPGSSSSRARCRSACSALPAGMTTVPLLSLSGPLKMTKLPVDHLGLDGVGLLASPASVTAGP